MSVIKISQLPTSTDITTPTLDWLPIVQGGTTKKISFDTIFKKIKSDVIINPELTSINVTINGHSFANLLKIDGTSNRVGVGIDPTEMLHVGGNAKIEGNVKVSQEVITVPSGSEPLIVNSSYAVTVLQTEILSLSQQTINLPIAANNQFKTIVYAAAAANKKINVQYTFTDNLIGATSIIFNKEGASVTLYGYNNSWIIVNYSASGVTII